MELYHENSIVILGSSPISEALIETFDESYTLIILSINKVELEHIKLKYNHVSIHIIDIIKESRKVLSFIQNCLIVVSLLPQELQYNICLLCLEANKNLITTSDLTDEIINLTKQVKSKGLLFLFECGCNPGIEHLIASKIISDARRQSSSIIRFENWSGSIPAPETTDNPFLYKFSWSPLESLRGMLSDSKQYINNRIQTISEKDLITSIVDGREFNRSYNFEGYYTKDSLKYKNIYELNEAKTIINGSIRYKAFSFIIQSFKFLNLFSRETFPSNCNTWLDFLSLKILDKRHEEEFYNFQSTYVPRNFHPEELNKNIESPEERYFYYRLTCVSLSFFEPVFILKNGFENLFNKLYSVFVYFGFYDSKLIVNKSEIIYFALLRLLEGKLKYKEHERDLVYIKNLYQIKTFSKRNVLKTIELIMYGKSNGIKHTATSYLVGATAGYITKAILDKKYSKNLILKGITVPYDEALANEIIRKYDKKIINIKETTELITKF